MLLFDERVQITEFNGEDLYQDLLATTLHNDSADLDTVPLFSTRCTNSTRRTTLQHYNITTL